jgi:peptidoglycan hydrolase-like protein with peptidoglycan-binding domain
MADPTIKLGSRGAAVKKSQRALTDRGYNPGAADGIFGAQTRRAVRSYQTDRKDDDYLPLGVDGIVGPNTWRRLAPPLTKRGAEGELVKLLQEHLNWYEGVIGGPIDVDGDFGSATETAVKEFQAFWGSLDVDGIVGRLTWTALWS